MLIEHGITETAHIYMKTLSAGKLLLTLQSLNIILGPINSVEVLRDCFNGL